jgi:EAL domain-containing protein (putative c-di-GMP-specific phosphodiesterase class I)
MEDMLKNADAALYKAKLAGSNTFQFHTHAMDVEAREFIKLESDLRTAIENNQLILYYQPKIHIKNGNIAGVEALLRWEHPELGILNPAQFIPIAEDTGLMNKMGEWALREACKTNKYWQDEGYEHFAVALNLSPKQFQHAEIAKTIEAVLKETGLNPKYLELEINESTVMDNIQIAKNRLDTIKSVGVQLSIDHFGAGYTSISHLKQFPISAIKIDQNYIKGIPNNPNDSAITNAFISLAHHLGLEVVAEGVETAEQVQYLTLQNCDMIQGYFLSHPLPQQKIEMQFRKLADRALF